jgi:hypothetical protein
MSAKGKAIRDAKREVQHGLRGPKPATLEVRENGKTSAIFLIDPPFSAFVSARIIAAAGAALEELDCMISCSEKTGTRSFPQSSSPGFFPRGGRVNPARARTASRRARPSPAAPPSLHDAKVK